MNTFQKCQLNYDYASPEVVSDPMEDKFTEIVNGFIKLKKQVADFAQQMDDDHKFINNVEDEIYTFVDSLPYGQLYEKSFDDLKEVYRELVRVANL